MADEQTPPERDVDELFTLDAPAPTEGSDGPLAHLLSSSPVTDLGAARHLPNITDVAGLEDLFATTDEVPGPDAPTRPPPQDGGSESPGREPEWRPVAAPIESGPTFDPLATFTSSAGPPGEQAEPLPFNPRLTQPVKPGDAKLPRPFEVGGELQFSTTARPHPFTSWPSSGDADPYPATLVPNAVPAPVAPSMSVRGPGQERRRGVLASALVDLTERRSFLGVAAAIAGIAVLGLLAAGNLLPNPLPAGRPDLVAESRVPSTSASVLAPETSADDTSSSTGAGSSGLVPVVPSSTVEPPTSVAPTTATRQVATNSARRVATTARPSVRSTTTAATATTTTTIDPSSTITATSSSSSTTDPTGSSTTDPDATTTSTTDATSSTDTTDPDATTTTAESTTTTEDNGGSTSSSENSAP